MTTMDMPALQLLADAVKRRREEELDIGIREACKRAGVSPNTWLKVERGEAISERLAARVYGRIDRALEWKVGSCREVLAGGEPTLLDGPPEPAVDERRRRLANHPDLVNTYDRVLRDTGLDPSDQREIIGALLELATLRDAHRLSSGSPT